MNLGTKCFENENEIVLSVGVLENNIITINKQVKYSGSVVKTQI